MKIDFAVVDAIVTNVQSRGPKQHACQGTWYSTGWSDGFEEARNMILAELHNAPIDNPLETKGDRR